MQVLKSVDFGKSWTAVAPEHQPELLENEAGFAASGTGIIGDLNENLISGVIESNNLNENLILDIRFNTLSNYVDKFIVVESRYDHQGNKKKLTFNIKNFNLIHIVLIFLI